MNEFDRFLRAAYAYQALDQRGQLSDETAAALGRTIDRFAKIVDLGFVFEFDKALEADAPLVRETIDKVRFDEP